MAFRSVLRGPGFASVLEPAKPGKPARLEIRLQISLVPLDPSRASRPETAYTRIFPPIHVATAQSPVRYGHVRDANGTPFNCRSLTTAEFNAAKIKFKRNVELVWNRQVILLPPQHWQNGRGLTDQEYLQFVDDPRRPARIECDLNVVLEEGIGDTPLQIVQVADKRREHLFRADSGRIGVHDLEFTRRAHPKWPDAMITQNAAAHEAGHLLMHLNADGRLDYFEHVNKANVPAGGNQDHEYGTVLSQRQAIMGGGNIATDHEASIWMTRAARHTGALFGWTWVHRVAYDQRTMKLPDRQRQLLGGKTGARAA